MLFKRSLTFVLINLDIIGRLFAYKGDCDWAEGYKDGQKYQKHRRHPIMCFDGKAQHQLVWLHKRDFRQLNLQDEHLEHRQEVQDYLVLHSKATTGLMNEIDDQSDDLYDDSRNGDANDDGQRSETLDFVGGDRTGITRNIPEIEPQRHVKVESSTQRSGRHQLWPMARRASPAMKSLDNSDSSHFSDFVDSSE